jgi:hypothetical protein
MLNKRQARFLRDLQRFVGSRTLAYLKGAMNEDDPLSRRPYLIPQATVPLFWDGEVPSHTELRRKSQPLLEDEKLNLLNVNALRLGHEFVDPVCDGTPKTNFMGTRVSGQETVGLKPKLDTFGISIAFVFRRTLSSD